MDELVWDGHVLWRGGNRVALARRAFSRPEEYFWMVFAREKPEGYASTLEEAQALAVAFYRMSNN